VPSPRLDYLKHGHYEGWGDHHDQEFRRTHRTEEITRDIAAKAGTENVSLVNELCNAKGGLMRAPDSGYSFFLDMSHLNPNGAEFLVRAIAPQLALGDAPASGRTP